MYMDTFSKLQPPNAVHIKVDIVVQDKQEDKDEIKFIRPRPRSTHITEFNSFFQISNKNEDEEEEEEEKRSNFVSNKCKIWSSKKLYVDPLMTSYDILYKLIVQAFDLKKFVFKFIYFLSLIATYTSFSKLGKKNK